MNHPEVIFAVVLAVMAVWLAIISVSISDRKAEEEESLITTAELAEEFDGLSEILRQELADVLRVKELSAYADDVVVHGVTIPGYYYLDPEFDPETYARKINASKSRK